MNSRQKATLTAIFDRPVPADLKWIRVASLFEALGATVRKGKGSHRVVTLAGHTHTFVEPHKGRAMRRYAVEDARDLITKAGLGPGDEG